MDTIDSQNDYIKRINNVFVYIDNHLESPLSLESIATIAHYSPFHFHRVFKLITGETLNAYITRKRIEKTAALLSRRKDISITDIYTRYGFGSSSSFSKAFKKFYGISPSQFREQTPSKYSKIRKVKSKNGQQELLFEEYICNTINLKKWVTMNAKIEVKEMPQTELAYVTAIGAQNLGKAYDSLMKWAIPKGLLATPETKVITIYHDSFKITAPDKVRMSACIAINDKMELGNEMGRTQIPNSRCIIGSYTIGVEEFEKAWTGLFVWMNENGYKKAAQDPYEIYHNNFNEHPEKKCIVDFCIPVE